MVGRRRRFACVLVALCLRCPEEQESAAGAPAGTAGAAVRALVVGRLVAAWMGASARQGGAQRAVAVCAAATGCLPSAAARLSGARPQSRGGAAGIARSMRSGNRTSAIFAPAPSSTRTILT